MPLNSKRMISLLKKNGYVEVYCGNGSHRKLMNPTTNITVVVPFHRKELSKGLEQAILKEAGIKEKL